MDIKRRTTKIKKKEPPQIPYNHTQNVKGIFLDFCNFTESWGDYKEKVYPFSEFLFERGERKRGISLIMEEKDQIQIEFGICNANNYVFVDENIKTEIKEKRGACGNG